MATSPPGGSGGGWTSRHSPPQSSHLASSSTSSSPAPSPAPSSSHGRADSLSGPAQYVDLPSGMGAASPQTRSPIRSGEVTPHGHLREDAKLLSSQPSSPSTGVGEFFPQTANNHPHPAFASTTSPNQTPVPNQHTPNPNARPARNNSAASFTPSPLNPSPGPSPFASTAAASPPYPTGNPFASRANSRPTSRGGATALPSPNDDAVLAGLGLGAANTSGFPAGQRGSMILYRFATADDARSMRSSRSASALGKDGMGGPLLPPNKLFAMGHGNRDSVASSSGSSMLSFASDSKGGSGAATPYGTLRGGLIPYAYDPDLDPASSPSAGGPVDDEDLLHDPSNSARAKAYFKTKGKAGGFPWRGVLNIGVLVLLILGLLCLFVFYPVLTFFRDRGKFNAIDGNIRINGTGQNPVLFQMPEPIDQETPDDAKTHTGTDGSEYELVFSDEFNTDGRSFYPGDDPYWEAVDLWYGATGDLEWYDPQQVTTRDGAMVITMDSTATTQAGITPGSTAPFTQADNHLLDYRSGMVQTWNKFCFTTGYVEVSVSFPGPNENTRGYWPGAWTMGNLGRPGYPAATDGMWPYTYDSCDVGTFPNQTNPDHLGPAAALHTDQGRSTYNFELSWLSGQRLSSCSCPNSDHPGPMNGDKYVGRGAPEIDIFEAEKDKNFAEGHVVSQSAQFAPFSHDYLYFNDTGDWTNLNPDKTRANTFRGSAVQQSISGLTRTPDDMFQGNGANFKKFGFEYWSDPNNRDDGYVQWMVDGNPSHRVAAAAVAPDQGDGGSGVGQRLIPEEPLALVLNLGISPNWQTIDLSTMMFPAEFKIDYIRVYQKKGKTNVGCDPKDRPTMDYINNHLEAYTNINMTTWQWPKPKNQLYEGGC